MPLEWDISTPDPQHMRSRPKLARDPEPVQGEAAERAADEILTGEF
jgi:hypothetical protein